MSKIIHVDAFLLNRGLSVVDVRSPSEFKQGHIPNAINIPLFDDSQRAEVGTLYKKVGRQAAMVRGLEFVGAKASEILKAIKSTNIEGEFCLHCWRGGMRSEAVAWFFEQCGFHPRRLHGGYKAFRQTVQRGLSEPRRIVILSGATGVGKTQLLSSLRNAGEQVIDLEHLAGHRGSVFGGIGRPPQPSVEQFENNLYWQWRDLDPGRPVWIECESQAIGRVFIPHSVWNQMKTAPAVNIQVDRDKRIEFLLEEYGGLPVEQLALAIGKVKKRLGGANLQAALAALDQNDLTSFTKLALDYYDKAYSLSLKKRPRLRTEQFQLAKSGHTDSIENLSELGAKISSEQPEAAITSG